MAKSKKENKIPSASGVDVFCSHTEIVLIEELVANPRNPNTHPEHQIAALAKIIKAQGWRQPITVSTRSGFIIKGHGRLMAARKMGVDRVPVDYQDYADEATEWADMIADNRIAELSLMNYETLHDLLGDLNTMGAIEMDITGYSDDEIQKIIDSGAHFLNESENEIDEDKLGGKRDGFEIKCPHCGESFDV